MAKVITVSRKFFGNHAKKGYETYFVERIINDLIKDVDVIDWDSLDKNNTEISLVQTNLIGSLSKGHTLRKGKRWKTGDFASLRFWSRLPYRSPQVKISKDIPIRVFDIEMCLKPYESVLKIDSKTIEPKIFNTTIETIANNDGLSYQDFLDWFGNDHFSGQIICWNSDISY
jgi:hypothetical protein